MSTHIVPQRIITLNQPPVVPQSIIYVGEPASKVYQRHEVRTAYRLRDAARRMRACGARENARAAMKAAMLIIRNLRTCNESIPRHRRIASLGWTGPVW